MVVSGGKRRPKKRIKLVRSGGLKPRVLVAPQARSPQRRQRPAAPPPPCTDKARSRSEERHLAFTTNILRYVDGRGRREPEGCTRTEATLSHLHHYGHLRAVCSRQSAAGD